MKEENIKTKEDTKKSGYCITTYTFRLYTNHKSYLKVTQEKFNALISRFYRVCLRHKEILEGSNRDCSKKLLKLTGITKDGEIGKEYFEIKLPKDLKRTAASMAVRYAKIYFTYLEKSKEDPNIGTPTKTRKFNSPVTFWTGMRKDIQEDGNMKLKLCTRRNEWRFCEVKIKGFERLKGLEILSPTIVIKKDYVLARIPVKHQIEDVTPVKYRLKEENVRICGITFSNSNNFAICTIIDSKGNYLKSLFVSGGNEYRHECKCILNKIYSDKCKIRRWQTVKDDHINYFKKLHNISEYYAHNVSKRIVEFCKENHVRIIAFADLTIYSDDKSYYYRKKIKKYTPIFLRTKILEYLKYKSFKEGILCKLVNSKNTSCKCYKCGGDVKRGKDELKVCCSNGHNMDYFFNSAMNIALACLNIKKS